MNKTATNVTESMNTTTVGQTSTVKRIKIIPKKVTRGVRSTASALISETTFHGLPKIFGAEKHLIERLVWAVISLVSWTYCTLYILSNIDEYYQYPVITNINRVYEKEAEFPAIVYCNRQTTLKQDFNKKKSDNSFILGNCFWFNYGKSWDSRKLPILKSEAPGVDHGFRLELIANETVKMFIFPQDESLKGNRLDNEIQISTGLETNMVITRTVVVKLGEPYRNCQTGYNFELGPFDNYNQSFYPYVQSDCFYLCPYRKNFEAINKTEEYLQNFQFYFTNYNKWIHETVNGRNAAYQREFSQIYANLTRKEKALGIFKYCEDICPVECKHVSYSVTPFYKLINSRSIAAVNIYYDEFAFTEITELPKITFDNLLANIGGVFGLFVGASWMSMVEIIEFVLNILYKFGEKLIFHKKVTIK